MWLIHFTRKCIRNALANHISSKFIITSSVILLLFKIKIQNAIFYEKNIPLNSSVEQLFEYVSKNTYFGKHSSENWNLLYDIQNVSRIFSVKSRIFF